MRAIKASGGITIVQQIETAKYDGMPRSAKHTGTVDLELPPEEIAKQLTLFDELAAKSDDSVQNSLPAIHDPYFAILSILEKASKVNFAQYKQSTIRRRLERRMVATRSATLKEYADYLRAKPDESRMLFQDILISVTSFFRDPASFEELSSRILERVTLKEPGQPFRCWVVGCATGEEAYSIAMLVSEAMDRTGKQLPVQIFATDIDEQAMMMARKGVYPRAALEDVSPELRARYFEENPESFRIKDHLRDMIVFARHDVTHDPPFLKMDLITCRNVLIYFGSKLQEYVLRTFHFALDQTGILFLGKSETVSAAETLFDLGDKNSRIFHRSGKKGDLPRASVRQEASRETILFNQDRASTTHVDLLHSLVSSFAPDSLLIDEDYRVRHAYGDANKFLNMPKGEPSTSVLKLLPQEISIELNTLLHRAAKAHQAVHSVHKHTATIDRMVRTIQLSVVPISHEGRKEYIVCFQHATQEAGADSRTFEAIEKLSSVEQVRVLKHELLAAREHLQTVIEEHETASEEMQALNEELQSSNEELQSTNEELETTNEELQSANEELTTLNQEVNVKSSELQALNLRLQAIQNAIVYPLIMVDTKLRIIDYNPASRYLLRVSDLDQGQHIRTVAAPWDLSSVYALLEEAMQKGRDAKTQIRTGDRDFEVRIQLFRGERDRVDGAVVSFVENTELVHALDQARVHRERLSAILENTPALVTMKDATGAYIYANQRFYAMTGLTETEVVSRTDEEIFGVAAGAPLRDRDFEVLKTRAPIMAEEVIPVAGDQRVFYSSKFPLLDERQKARSICTVAVDITERTKEKHYLRMFREVVSASNAGIAILEERDSVFKTVLVSKEFAARLGAAQSEFVGVELEAFLERFLQGVRSISPSELARQLKSKTADILSINLREKDGGDEWVEVRANLMPVGDDGAQYAVLTVFDISEKVHTQRMIEAQQEEVSKFSKLASLGEVAAGISHEINTPLNVISTRTDLLRKLAVRDMLDKEKIDKASAEIDGMVHTISNVITGLRTVSGLENHKKHPNDACLLVREAARICDFRVQRQGVKLELDLPGAEIKVECFPVQIVQVLVNLINNAIDAVSGLRDRWVRVEVRGQDGKARVRVVDSGDGIDPSMAEKIMAPFFTTKKTKGGTGLGLSISRTIARRHGGELSCDTHGRNTTFVLELPMHHE